MQLTLKENYDYKRLRGHKMKIDALKGSAFSEGHCSVRVVGEWNKPTWLSIYWFEGKLNRTGEYIVKCK